MCMRWRAGARARVWMKKFKLAKNMEEIAALSTLDSQMNYMNFHAMGHVNDVQLT